MKSWFKKLSVLFLVVMVFAGCSSNKPVENVSSNSSEPSGEAETPTTNGGEIIFGTVTETPSLDPFLEAADERSRRTVLMYEGLTWVDEKMQVQPRLAGKWEISEDGKVYTFTLRDDVYFHNGAKMTAEDVKYSYELFLDESFGTGGAGDFTAVDSIEIVDDTTVKFTLKTPYASLLAALGGRYGAVVPKGTYDNGDLKNEAVGTGPFKLVKWTPNNSMVLEKFDQYWSDERGFLDKITIQIVPDENSLLAGIRSGQIDAALLTDSKFYTMIKDNPKLNVERHPALRWTTLDFANNVEPFNDPRVRQAILKGIDKEEVMIAATDGVGSVIGAMPPAFSDWVVPVSGLENQTRDVEGAKKLLAEAGYADGFNMPLRIISSFAWMRPAAEVIASNLSEIGITVDIETVDLGVWIKDWSNYNSPNTFNEWGGFTDPDLLYYRHFRAKPEGGDWRRWNNEEGSKLLDQARVETQQEARQEIYNSFQHLMATEVPSIPLFSPDSIVVSQKHVIDYIHHPSGWWYGLTCAKVQK
ncbi:ABC transporter substrate-binding protein [Schinkia azotoformans]|uniref:ABC transporter periplasmic protein n=1 Tax=Schinkia azotoformans LMG 9581 TaxID=1131731 RepID=K6CT67_SCHAZ|nr:ABC transporter substrate-binding protein [Schinkia azotoformans]EKN63447.1 ABC transporter periplasmic protein [Schinkia azotoformans LMG 9581]MEC1638746.1 ABC transporter substrate-binding protein [Schinkia azotoformans]MEC1946711.1 ABC transporter substrate-binding protein [Schinkia azotoformans]